MQRRIIWKTFFIFSLAVIALSDSYYLRYFGNDIALNNQQQIEILQRPESFVVNRNIYFWNNNNDSFEKVTKNIIIGEIPKNKNIVTKKEQADLNNNLIQETYTLENSQLIIVEKENIIWQSPNSWRIDNFILADSNNDGVLDINLSVWKAGNFGESKPFWTKENDMSVKNHFFIFDFVDDAVRSVWQSSNLENPNCEFIFADIDGDGENDLIAVEGNYSQELICLGNYVAVWKWNGWGFSNEWRSEKGNFANLEIKEIGEENYIATNSLIY